MDNSSTAFWDTIYRQHISRMVGICYRYTQNRQTAEDLAHQAFLVAIDKVSHFQNKGPFEAWLRRIVVNTSLQWLRDQRKQQVFEKSMAHHTGYYDTSEDNMSNEPVTFSKAELLHAVNLLPEQHRLVFNLYVIDKFTHAEIGNQLGIAEGTSKSHLARARKKIREILFYNNQEDKKRKKGFLLLLFHYKTLSIDALISKNLKDLAIKPQTLHAPVAEFNKASFDTSKTSIGHYKNYWQLSKPVAFVAASIVVIAVLYFTPSLKNKSTIASESTQDAIDNTENKASLTDTSTATIPGNRIIDTEQTKKSVKMKNLIPAAALLLSGLAIDTPALSSRLPLDLSGQQQNYDSTVPRKPAVPASREPMHGTIYASKLSWLATNYAIEVRGNKVAVNLNTQHFKGSGTFSFIDNVHLLIVDGTPVKLGETIELAEKAYSFNQLTPDEATKKYGDKGKVGAVEIAVAE